MGKKVKLAFALGLISLAVFIVGSFSDVICTINENNPSPEWQEIGNKNCLNTEAVTQWLSNFVDFIGNSFAKK